MTLINQNGILSIELYHGTSTLFLNSIIENGLGAINPIKKWKILELAKEVYELSEIYIPKSKIFFISSPSFKRMIDQDSSGTFNFQHGQTYISPSKSSAIRYAVTNEYGSELLTYTMKFLRKLVDLEIDYVTTILFKKYKPIYNLLESRPSPLLISINNIKASELLSEYGDSPESNFNQISEVLGDEMIFDVILQQTNFRLLEQTKVENLKFHLINITESNNFNLYGITI